MTSTNKHKKPVTEKQIREIIGKYKMEDLIKRLEEFKDGEVIMYQVKFRQDGYMRRLVYPKVESGR